MAKVDKYIVKYSDSSSEGDISGEINILFEDGDDVNQEMRAVAERLKGEINYLKTFIPGEKDDDDN